MPCRRFETASSPSLGLSTCTTLVVGNMVGSGIFLLPAWLSLRAISLCGLGRHFGRGACARRHIRRAVAAGNEELAVPMPIPRPATASLPASSSHGVTRSRCGQATGRRSRTHGLWGFCSCVDRVEAAALPWRWVRSGGHADQTSEVLTEAGCFPDRYDCAQAGAAGPDPDAWRFLDHPPISRVNRWPMPTLPRSPPPRP